MTSNTPVIAVLTDRYIQYQAGIAENLATEINAAGYGMLCITAKEIQPLCDVNATYSVCNSIYSQLNKFDIDGIIALSGTIGHGVNIETLTDFLINFNAPTVSFGMCIENLSSVYFDERIGMSKLMRHLLTDKTRNKYAFVRGHPNDAYSLLRENIFCQSLISEGYNPDDIQYLEGDYCPFKTYEVVRDLLNSNTDIDCIVAANDVMAASAARAVKAHGLSIPHDIAISGFDDSIDATRHSPALTTVRQPTGKMAQTSVALLLQQIDQNKCRPSNSEPDNTISHQVINSELIIRRSTNFAIVNDEFVGPLSELKLRNILNNAMSGLDTPKQLSMQQISEPLWLTLEAGSIKLVELVKGLSDDFIMHYSHWWQNLCGQVDSLDNMFIANGYRKERLALVSLAISQIKERIWSLEMDKRFETSRLQNARSDMQLAMSSCTDIESIISAMKEWLANLKPPRCFLIQYQNPENGPSSLAESLLVYRHGNFETPPAKLFQSTSVLPDELLNELSIGLLVFSPIYADDIIFGYLLFDPSNMTMPYLDAAAQCIGNAMRTHHHIEELQKQKSSLQSVNKKLSHLANYDALTGLANRFQFQQYIESRTSKTIKSNDPFALLFLDLDGFKSVNDTLGHDAGDQLLVQVAERLRKCIADSLDYSGFISRLGGDEFTIILNNKQSNANIHLIAQQLLDRLSFEYALPTEVVNISASIGCAFYPDDALNAPLLMKHADIAMYHAKESGKNNIVFFDSSQIQGNKKKHVSNDPRPDTKPHNRAA